MGGYNLQNIFSASLPNKEEFSRLGSTGHFSARVDVVVHRQVASHPIKHQPGFIRKQNARESNPPDFCNGLYSVCSKLPLSKH